MIFLDSLGLQARLGIIQRRPVTRASGDHQWRRSPVTAASSASIAFRKRIRGFDVMISPRQAASASALTRANHVIHLARWWNPAVEDQCTDGLSSDKAGRSTSTFRSEHSSTVVGRSIRIPYDLAGA